MDRVTSITSARPAGQLDPSISPATDLLSIIGRDGCFEQLASAFQLAFGYTEVDLLDQPVIGFIHTADRAATLAALEQLAQGEPTLSLVNRFRCKDGSFRRLAWTALSMPQGLLYAVARDITECMHADEEQAQARSMAGEQAAALAQKEELLDSICHDLQQPLTVILAQTQLLQQTLAHGRALHGEPVAGQCLAYIFAAARRMRDMTRELLDASLQHSGRPLPLLLVRTDLVALTRQTVNAYQCLSDLHNFLFEAEVPTLEAGVDENRLYRVLANLLTNAIKYSPDGGAVRVTVTATQGPDSGSALLIVRDEGIGIPRDDLPHVFDRFHRGANVVGRIAGTGLGLASARALVEMHGGTISVESEEGRGSTFTVRLPLGSPAEFAGLR